ncbi:LpqB family beta-propeller domain-containing protein [Microbacterium sp. NPDC058062]|uniref:LpqB family beta-propeller domain-containing protein n=1 Tax=Microbacterium sp. NPDC058062 TaxID=3346320 RepID=UPI0036D75C38
MTRVRGILALILALCAVVVTGCAGFPTSGPPEYGLENGNTGNGSQNVVFIPNRPQPGATPQQIVEGFIDAGSGPGVLGNWAVAQEFLAPSLRGTWNPDAQVIVDERAERDYVETGEGVVDFASEVVGSVDDKGAYQRADLSPASWTFRLEQQDDGEWRITEAPDGIWLDEAQFPQVFHRYPLMYFDPSYQYLVPDVRWFAVTKAAGSIANALVNKPKSEWLEESVETAFPDGVSEVAVVPTADAGVSDVALKGDAMLAASSDDRNRMLTQLEESLRAAGVAEVVMTVDSAPIEAQPVAVRSTRVPATPLVLTQAGFGFLTGDEIDKIPGLSAAVEAASPLSVQVGAERDLAAARLASGAVVRLNSAGTEPEVLDTRPGLVDPVIDQYGVVWSVPQDDPAALRAYLPNGDVIEVADAWGEGTAIAGMALSRDGTRLAAVVSAGGRSVVAVAGVIRDDIAPVRLGQPLQLAVAGGAVVGVTRIGVTWIDDVSVGVLTSGADADSTVIEQVVGAPTSTSTAPSAMASIAGGSGISSLRLRAEDGTLYVKRGTSWQPTATGIGVLATQQGAPQ